MAPFAKVIVGPVSIPAQYNIPDAQLFTQKWWAEATKTNLFWTQFKRYLSRGTVHKRIGLEIKTDIVESTRGLQTNFNVAEIPRRKTRPKQQPRPGVQSTPSYRSTTAKSGTEEQSDSESDADTIEETPEIDETGVGGEIPIPRRSGRARRRPAAVHQVQCTQCKKVCTFSDVNIGDDGNLVCEACNDTGPEPELLEPRIETQASRSAQAEPQIIKVEDEEPRLQDRSAATVAATKAKRQREDDGRIVKIHGEDWLIYADEYGEEHAVKLGTPKKIKIELD